MVKIPHQILFIRVKEALQSILMVLRILHSGGRENGTTWKPFTFEFDDFSNLDDTFGMDRDLYG